MRSVDPDFLIDGVPVLAPDAGVETIREDVESEASGMDERGIHHRFVLRSRRKKWKLRYGLLTGQEVQYLRGLFAGKDSVTVQYQEPDGTAGSCTAWCGGDSAALVDKNRGIWKDMVLTISEC